MGTSSSAKSMLRVGLILAAATSASAFSTAGNLLRRPVGSGAFQQRLSMMADKADKSKSMPFMARPPALDGTMVGDVGFDPLGISTTIMDLQGDLNYVREAEITHGRLAMIATLGWIFPEVVGTLPGRGDFPRQALEAQAYIFDKYPEIAYQILFSVAISEGIRSQIIFKPDHVPGEVGFDPLGFKAKFCKTPEAYKSMQLKELKNGRLAMWAITGLFVEHLATGKPVFSF